MSEAAVTLSASDQISAPARAAIASLESLNAEIAALSAGSKPYVAASAAGAAGMNSMSDAAANSVVPHRAAHQTLALVSRGMAEMAGASAVAEGGIKIVDSIMFQMAMHGGAVSLGFVALAAAAIGVGTAMRSSAEEAKKEADALTAVTTAAIASVAQLNYLDRAQKSVAGVGAGQMQTEILKTKQAIAELTQKMKENAEASHLGHGTSFLGTIAGGLKDAFNMSGGGPHDTATAASAAAQAKMAGDLRAQNLLLGQQQHQYDELTKKAKAYHTTGGDFSRTLATQAAGLKLFNDDVEAIGNALQGVDVSFDQVMAKAQQWGVTGVQAAEMIGEAHQATFQNLRAGAVETAKYLGQAMGQAAMGMKGAFASAASSILSIIIDAAIKMVLANVLAAKTAAAAWAAINPWMIVSVVGIAAVGAAGVAALGGMKSGGGDGGVGSFNAATGVGSASSGSSPSGPGGSAISSAQKEVTNNITVNLPIQTLDVSSVSDMQLRSLATRVGRVLADAAGTGQFSLVGA